MNKNAVAYLVTTLDTKGEEVIYVRDLLIKQNITTKIIDLSTQPYTSKYPIDVDAATVANYHPQGQQAVFCGDRGKAIIAMSVAFTHF